jgi:perosamine synthetase
MVTCNDPELARRLRLARNHGIDGDARSRHAAGRWFYEQVALGYNYRLTDIGAALGLSQLKRLDLNLSRRREIVAHYAESLSRRAELTLPPQREHARSAWHLYPVRLRLDLLRGNRSEILAALRAEGIGANVHYVPVHMHPYYRARFGDRTGLCPIAEAAYESLVSLPLFPSMTDNDVADVVTAVEKVLDAYGA